MHFRERNRVVQVIRTTYNRETQKGKPEIVARLNKTRPVITDEVRKNCDADELREIEAWVAANAPAAAASSETPRQRAKARRLAMAAAAQLGVKAGVITTPAPTTKPRRARRPTAIAPWIDAKTGVQELIARLDQAIVWFRRNKPTDERKALAAGLALSMRRVRTVLRKKGWVAQKSGADS